MIVAVNTTKAIMATIRRVERFNWASPSIFSARRAVWRSHVPAHKSAE